MAQTILIESSVAINDNQTPESVPATITHVEFHGFQIPTVMHEGQPFFAVKPVCEAIGLDFRGQFRNVKKDAVLGPTVVNLTTVAEDGKIREMLFLPVRFFNGWIFKIDANRYVIKKVREALIMYQREGYDVMFAYFNRGIAVNPNAIQDAPSGPTLGTLTPAQQQELKELVQAKASAYPDAVKPKVFSQIWMRLQRKFKVPRYSELPVAVFGEARDYVIGMQVHSVGAPALGGMEAKALPPATPPLSTLRDYASIFRGLPDKKLDYWSNLSRRLVRAHDAFQKELDAIKKDALRPFRENRRIEVATLLDFATVDSYKRMFEIAEDGQHVAYRGVYGALTGLESLHELLVRG